MNPDEIGAPRVGRNGHIDPLGALPILANQVMRVLNCGNRTAESNHVHWEELFGNPDVIWISLSTEAMFCLLKRVSTEEESSASSSSDEGCASQPAGIVQFGTTKQDSNSAAEVGRTGVASVDR
jgi:hypothetical protein